MTDWQGHYDTLFDELGVGATLITKDGHPPISVTVIDKTEGIEIDTQGAGILTVYPAAAIRASELTDDDLEAVDLNDAQIEFNGATWHITGKYPRPSPAGESIGQVYLLLTKE